MTAGTGAGGRAAGSDRERAVGSDRARAAGSTEVGAGSTGAGSDHGRKRAEHKDSSDREAGCRLRFQ